MLEQIVISVLIFGSISTTESANCSNNCLRDTNTTTESCNVTSGECLFGCIPGYYGFNCSTECSSYCASSPSNQLDVCDAKTGNCTYGCKSGFTGFTCSCSENCVTDLGRSNDICDPVSGECSLGCIEGYAGLNCSFKCSSNCRSSQTNQSDVCNAKTGYCTHGCKFGFIGSTCSCSEHCVNDGQSDNDICDLLSGECSLGCQQGYAGPNCSYECSSNCRPSPTNQSDACDAKTGYCTHGCNIGFIGSTCSCSEHCVNGSQSDNDICDLFSGECSQGCQQGYAGPNCSYECSSTCGLVPDLGKDTCNITTGECKFGCATGFAGLNCSIPCPKNCAPPTENSTETCNASSKDCLHGCSPGFARPQCDFNCSDNCKTSTDIKSDTCNASTGECLLGCKYGYTGQNCTVPCPSNCGISDELYTKTCNETSMSCVSGCIQGYAGSICSYRCPENCFPPSTNNSLTCNETNGACSLGCLPGYAGPNCSFECPANCSHPLQNNTETCDNTSGQCLHGCQAGQAGPNCSFVCPSNCELHAGNETETCNATNGECLYGCQGGYAGPNCSVECPKTCAFSNIRGAEICNATSDECLYGCLDGHYGARCENKCNDDINNCKKCSLQSDNSVICDECIHNFYKNSGKCTACNYWCFKNATTPQPFCRENDGYCIYDCAVGWYGFKCDIRCRSTCKDKCSRDLGHCVDCNPTSYCGSTCQLLCSDGCVSSDCEQSCSCRRGCTQKKWGDKCEKPCSVNCNEPSDLNSNICERSTGTCSYKCKNETFWGNQCDKQCSSKCNGEECEQANGNCTLGCSSKEVYGIGCDKECNKNCVNGTCERDDGYCDSGCVLGSYGNQCDKRCSANCANRLCNRTTAVCYYGCVSGWYGAKCGNECSLTCSERVCDRNTGNCESCKSGYKGSQCKEVDIFDTNWIYVASACGAVVLLGVMITIVLVTKKRRLIARRKRAERMSKIPDEKFLEEAQLRHRRKGEGAGARITQLFVENPLARFMKYRSHGGALITKIPLDELLRRVLKMEENDYGREFDEFTVGLTKSHEASRKLDNLTLNFFNGIYPYDENRVTLRRTFEDVTRKSKSKRGILKSVHFVTFRPTRDADYETLEVSTSSGGQEDGAQNSKPAKHTTVGADKSNGYSSVVFDVSDETSGASAKPDNDISDDYATVEVGGGDKPSASVNDSNIPLTQLKTSEEDQKEDCTADKADDADADYAQVDKSNKSDGAKAEKDTSIENSHVNKAFDSSSIEQTENDELYSVVHKDKKINDKDDGDDRHFNKQSAKKDGSVVIQKDYINASFIKGYNQNERYIAAQAPSKATANDFWLMVWEQKSQFVIMLTVIPEDGYSRCEKYWPDKDVEETFGEINVIGESVDEYADYIIRTFKMSLKNGQERDVVHMQFTSWPEEGCPVSAIEFIEFHQKYRSMTKGRHSVGPTIVHCTAGIGRTGVFLALDILVEEGLDSLSVDVFKCVNALREQRVDMVHSMEQYEFLYKAVAQTFALECQPYHKVRLQDRLTELKKFDHNSGKSKLEVLYDSMKASLGLDTVVIASLDVVQERRKKDRPKSDVPDVLFRASLPRNIYINAVVFESSRKREAMVATQMPTPDTVQDFCQLLIYHQCATVIMLNNVDPNDKTIGTYWPTEKTPFVAGQTIITQLHVEKQTDYIIRQLRIHNPELIAGEGSAQAVTMIQYKGWKIVKNVPSAKNLLKLLQLCQRYIKDSPDKRLLVHCMDGAEQSGLFCALVNLLESVDTEDEISVTSVVRKILARRPNAIPTLDQFEVCFSTTCEYIKKHESAA